MDSCLFRDAWKLCEKAHRFYADAAIRYYYSSGDRLKIERVTRESLQMDSCYINVAIVQHQTGNSTLPRKTRPALWNPVVASHLDKQDDKISLSTLFDARQLLDNTIGRPRRILIQGQAGVGKTTLCKKMVYDYVYNSAWADKFDRLIWIPLRSLKKNPAKGTLLSYSLKQFFRATFFRDVDDEDGDYFFKAIKKAMDGHANRKGTLFLLDGLDEVSRMVGGSGISETPTSAFVRELLGQKYAIITTRPSGVSIYPSHMVDLELETIGFQPQQVRSYVQNVSPKTAGPIIRYIQSHVWIDNVLHVPILLDAFCATWTSGSKPSISPQTMSGLYADITSMLWKNDLLKLSRLLEAKAADMSSKQIDRLEEIQDPNSLLELLAFTGIYNDVIEYDPEQRKGVLVCWQEHTDNWSTTGSDLLDYSFLRTSDGSERSEDSTFNFLHLTYQEFFAAKHFVKCWRQKE
ncbi:hypothetical protein GQ53DRAFT_662060, partial [Thozetella sp. PMI_491]